MNYIDLFHGIGGFALGAYWAGMKFENHFCSDIEPYAQQLYKLRFPDSIQLGDITKIDTEELKKYGDKWIITGGFPCQDISIAGKGAGITGARSGLWFEYWRLINDLRPDFAIMENVGALTFRGLDTVIGSLSEIGYNAEWQDIRAEDVGAPHKRERIWIVAYAESRESRESSEWERQESIGGGSEKISDTMCSGLQAARPEQQTTRIAGSDKEFPYSTSEGLEREIPTWCSRRQPGLFAKCDWWSTEPAVGRLVDGLPGRVDRLKGLGNAIVPQIAELLFNQIKEYL